MRRETKTKRSGSAKSAKNYNELKRPKKKRWPSL
jgi:hypothetical protein